MFTSDKLIYFIFKLFSYTCPLKNKETENYWFLLWYLPKTGARVNNPVTCCFLSHSFLNQSFFGSKQFHCKFVVCWLKYILKLISYPSRFIGRFIEIFYYFTWSRWGRWLMWVSTICVITYYRILWKNKYFIFKL